MPIPNPPAAARADTGLHTEVQQFYARQMHFLDGGDIEEWAGTFTEDGVFAANAQPTPQRGRAAITEGARAARTKLAERGIQRRHWLGMLDVEELPDETISARSYAIVLAVPYGGQTAVELSCTCSDILVREDGQLRVRRREVSRDDLTRR